MTEQITEASSEPFEYMLLEKDAEHFRSVFSGTNQQSPWIAPNSLNLKHRIGRGPFGDVWIAIIHQKKEDFEHYHEVAAKMLCQIKEDQLQIFSSKFDEIYTKYVGLEGVCFLHGISIQNGRICLAMKLYEGSIGDKMARLKGGKLSLPDVLRYGTDLARGIMELHSRGIFILNLKPCNFLLDENDQALVGDFGIPYLLFGLTLPSPELIHRLGTPNYMAPEQWLPTVRGPISHETDSWGFGCSIVEMLTGVQPWRGKSADEIYQLVVLKRDRPNVPSGLPPAIEDVLFGCFEYDLRNRPLMADILHAFESSKDLDFDISTWTDAESGPAADKVTKGSYTNWSLFKDKLQVGDKVRSRKPKGSTGLDVMEIPEGTVVGVDSDGHVLVRVHGFHDPFRVRSSAVERLAYGFAAGDWVRLQEEEKNRSQVGILHSIDRDGLATVGLIGMDSLWKGNCSALQMAEAYHVGQFVRLKLKVSSPRFNWPVKKHRGWATGNVAQVLPNGCLVVKFPGRFTFTEPTSCLADPSEVEVVSFEKCKGAIDKYWHLEDFHWAVRPLVVGLGLFVVLQFGLFVGAKAGRPGQRSAGIHSEAVPQHQQQRQLEQHVSGGTVWLPPKMANIIFGDNSSPAW